MKPETTQVSVMKLNCHMAMFTNFAAAAAAIGLANRRGAACHMIQVAAVNQTSKSTGL